VTKFRYLLIVFLLIFFLTNFIFVKKSLAACILDGPSYSVKCTSSADTYTVNSGVTKEGKDFGITFDNNSVSPVVLNDVKLENSGTIRGNDIGLKFGNIGDDWIANSDSTKINLINNVGGIIEGLNTGAIYIYNGTSNSSVKITNSGTIEGKFGAYAIGNDGNLTITNFSTGIITSDGGYGINSVISLDLTNNGTISSTGNGGGYTGTVSSATGYSSGTLTLVNTGTISANGSGLSAVYLDNGTGIITNSGIITALGSSGTMGDTNGILNYGTISAIINTGTISSTGGKGYGINNQRTITKLNNAQTGLTYNGNLPSEYNIILGINASTFGTIAVSNPSSSTTTFGIASGSTVKATRYAGVITGVIADNLSDTTGTYGTYSWSLSLQSGTTIWDLLFPSYVSGPSSADTDTSLLTVASNLKGVINYQNSSLNHSLNYDCSYFGKSNSCMSSSVRNSNTKDNDSQSVAIIAATKIGDQVRVGGFIDGTVNKDHNSDMKLNSNNPMFGAFVRFNKHDQNFGLKGGVSAGYIDQDLKSTRVATGTSEPGTGTSNLNTKGIQAEIQYGIDAASFLTVSPYVGYRNTQTTRDKYTEETSSTVTTPLTYNKIKQTEETAFAGIELKSHFHTTDKFATLNLGYEHAAKFSIDNLSTSGVSGTSDVNLGSNIDKTRPVITASLNQDLGTSGRLSLNFDRRQQVYSPTNSTNVALQYVVGF